MRLAYVLERAFEQGGAVASEGGGLEGLTEAVGPEAAALIGGSVCPWAARPELSSQCASSSADAELGAPHCERV